MAQVAIPLILLGGAYVLSNQDSSKKSQHNNNKDLQYFSPQSQSRSNVGTRIRENFQPNNRNKPEVRAQQLPNTNTPLPNYPVSVNSPMNGIAQQLMKSEPEHYDGTNNATELYFQQAAYEAQAENDTMNQFTSLNGSTVSKYHFKHNNMVPYFGSNVRQNTDPDRLDGNEARLDAMNGSGSQHFRKQETAPMFQPQENLQWGSGMPSTSDFVQSRMNPSTSMANVKPFQEVRVGLLEAQVVEF